MASKNNDGSEKQKNDGSKTSESTAKKTPTPQKTKEEAPKKVTPEKETGGLAYIAGKVGSGIDSIGQVEDLEKLKVIVEDLNDFFADADIGKKDKERLIRLIESAYVERAKEIYWDGLPSSFEFDLDKDLGAEWDEFKKSVGLMVDIFRKRFEAAYKEDIDREKMKDIFAFYRKIAQAARTIGVKKPMRLDPPTVEGAGPRKISGAQLKAKKDIIIGKGIAGPGSGNLVLADSEDS